MIDQRHIVMTDERLDYLAERFRNLGVRERLHVTFAQYLRDPAHYDAQAVQAVAREILSTFWTSHMWVSLYGEE